MKNIALILSGLVLTITVGAIPAFSGSGPYGTAGPADYSGKPYNNGYLNAPTPGGTGPYGELAIFRHEPGEVSKVASTPGGSGPYGILASTGMIPGSGHVTAGAKDECILLAKNCLPDR